ncbi:AAA family ATPase [Aureispira sp. CCB-E]|uniref:McrB family protein n=1 Tax=Aureispira sp. CCB-E TaxID=3051121 RepID=UPI0028691D32|nr:AAA family ATPase [Aureispira sp. CCB-E]WMX17127.1 AAA family ATPase [Aureispira sp. CCB-E]
MEFFNEKDFTYLKRYAGQKKSSIPESQETYNYLKDVSYEKLKHLAITIGKNLFEGQKSIHVHRRPINQGGNFQEYLWAKIYPTPISLNNKILAYTLSIDTEDQYVIKIDTVGLNENDKLREIYLKYRGDYFNSEIVKIYPKKELLSYNWEELIKLTEKAIQELIPKFDIIATLLGIDNNSNHAPTNITIEKLNIPLNKILFGPPGTGKTYHTINHAVQIIENLTQEELEAKYTNRKQLTDQFNTYKEAGRIVFCTFHQSMGYEDFVEGMKPLEPKEEGRNITYKVIPGLFRKICTEANKQQERSILIGDDKIPLTEEIFRELYYNYTEKLPNQKETHSNFQLNTPEGYPFYLYKNSVGSVIVKAGTMQTSMNICFNQLSRVLFEGKSPTYKSYEQKVIDDILKDKNLEKNQIDNSLKNYVLIIDEINRGNTSQIFGELITLIEEDKRAGNDEELEIKLAYSRDPFSVPSNLYILGTMNTADRSVEALDTALRRRFSFEEIAPNPHLIKTEGKLKKSMGVVSEIDLTQLLTIINKRIEVLLDKDHLIGHSYFMKIKDIEDLKYTFYNQIIPLLQEYFFGDYGKIGLILGIGFVKEQYTENNLFSEFPYEGIASFQERKTYLIHDYRIQKELFIKDSQNELKFNFITAVKNMLN